FAIQQRYARIRQNFQTGAVGCISDPLKVVVYNFEVRVFIDERVDVVIALTTLAVGCKKSPVRFEKKNTKVVARGVDRLTEIFNPGFSPGAFNHKDVESSITRMSVRGEVQLGIIGYIGE